MRYRELGRTGLEISEIGFGAEWMEKKSAAEVRAVVERENQTLHVESARLSGLPERRVIVKNLLPGIVAPVAQSAASVVPYLIGGTVIIESLFSFPGLGTLLVNAVLNREPDLLMACSAVVIAVSLAAFWIADGLGRRRSREIEA